MEVKDLGQITGTRMRVNCFTAYHFDGEAAKPEFIDTYLLNNLFGPLGGSHDRIITNTLPCGRFYAYSFESFPRQTFQCRCGGIGCWVVVYGEIPEPFRSQLKERLKQRSSGEAVRDVGGDSSAAAGRALEGR